MIVKAELAMIGEPRKLFKLLRHRLEVMPVCPRRNRAYLWSQSHIQDDACARVLFDLELRRYKYLNRAFSAKDGPKM